VLSTGRRDAEDESLGLQEVVSRSFIYVYFPVLILGFLAMNLIWEVIRANTNSAALESWPLRFTLLNLPTTAALLGAIGALLIGRMQWAHANRPTIGFAIDDEDARFDPKSTEWRVWLNNGGPGIARIVGFRYTVRFVRQPSSVPATLTEINDAMGERGFIDGKDFFLRWIGRGAPFPPVSHYTSGKQIARFSVATLAEFDELDIEVTVVDGVGDTHRRLLLIIDRLPSVTRAAVDEVRRAKNAGPSPRRKPTV
jgi:hypothetical protein